MATGGGSAPRRTDKCLTCNENVTKKDPAVSCDVCLKWCHIKCCGIDVPTYETMKAMENIRWYCDSCVKKILKLISDVARVEEKQDKIDEEVGNVKELVERTRSEISQMRQETVNDLGGVKQLVEQTASGVSQLRQETEKEMESVRKLVEQSKGDILQLQKEFDMVKQSKGDMSLLRQEVDKGLEVLGKQNRDEIMKMRQEMDKSLVIVDHLKKWDINKEVAELTNAFVNDGSWAEVVRKHVTNEMKGVKGDVEEQMEIERRRKNLIVFGVPESETGNDIDTVSDIITQALKLDFSRHIESIVRIGKFSHEKARPIKMIAKTFEGKREILTRAKMLRELDDYKGIFVAPDLTRKQQEFDKDLRVNLKKIREAGEPEAVIRSGQIIKKNENGKTISVLYPKPPQQLGGK